MRSRCLTTAMIRKTWRTVYSMIQTATTNNMNPAQLANRKAVTSIDADGELTLDSSDIDGNHGLFSSSAPTGEGFPTGEDQTYTYVDGMPDDMDPVVEEHERRPEFQRQLQRRSG